MLQTVRTNQLPDNFQDFVEEIAADLGALYGAAAAEHYRQVARPTLSATLEHPLVDALVVREGDRTLGMALGFARDAAARITFVHVLRDAASRNVERRLVQEAVRTFRGCAVDAVVAECVTFGVTCLNEAFTGLDFDCVPREIMLVPLDAPGLEASPAETRPLSPGDYCAAAEVIADAYVGHADRRVHLDARNLDAALAFVEIAAEGGYGRAPADYLRGLWHAGECVGVLLGCEPMPGVGFVLQVAVRRSFQGHGAGTRLLRDAAGAFRANGLTRAALGVTTANPARRLYARLGFERLKPIVAYAWWRPDALGGF